MTKASWREEVEQGDNCSFPKIFSLSKKEFFENTKFGAENIVLWKM